jgi:hypothetical protein
VNSSRSWKIGDLGQRHNEQMIERKEYFVNLEANFTMGGLGFMLLTERQSHIIIALREHSLTRLTNLGLKFSQR